MKMPVFSFNFEENKRMIEEERRREERSAARKRLPYEVIEELKHER